MDNRPPAWVDPLMRLGFAARGIVYVLVGALALVAALDNRAAPDSKSALATLLDQPFGKSMLLLVALGLFAYAIWRVFDAVMDLDAKGDDLKGWSARAAQLISAGIHCTLGMSALLLMRGIDRGNQTKSWTAELMSQPFGRILVAAVGVIVIAMGVQHFVKAFKEKYRQELRYTAMAARLDRLVKYGLLAHGFVILIVGAFFIFAAWTADPGRAGGLGDALNALRRAAFGQELLALVALGLLGFSAYCFVAAAFRIVPRCASGLDTLASFGRNLALQADSAVTRALRANR